MVSERRPCLVALRLATALPSGVVGPVDFLAFCLLAASCFSLVGIECSFVEGAAEVFCADVVGFLVVVVADLFAHQDTRIA